MRIAHTTELTERMAEEIYLYFINHSDSSRLTGLYPTSKHLMNMVNNGYDHIVLFTKKNDTHIVITKNGAIPNKYRGIIAEFNDDMITEVIGGAIVSYFKANDLVEILLASDIYITTILSDKGAYFEGFNVARDFINYNYKDKKTLCTNFVEEYSAPKLYSCYLDNYFTMALYKNTNKRNVSKFNRVGIEETPTSITKLNEIKWLRNSIKQINNIIATHPENNRQNLIDCGLFPLPTGKNNTFYAIIHNREVMGYLNAVLSMNETHGVYTAYCNLIAWSPKAYPVRNYGNMSDYMITQYRNAFRKWMMHHELDALAFKLPVGYMDTVPGAKPCYIDPLVSILPMSRLDFHTV